MAQIPITCSLAVYLWLQEARCGVSVLAFSPLSSLTGGFPKCWLLALNSTCHQKRDGAPTQRWEFDAGLWDSPCLVCSVASAWVVPRSFPSNQSNTWACFSLPVPIMWYWRGCLQIPTLVSLVINCVVRIFVEIMCVLHYGSAYTYLSICV